MAKKSKNQRSGQGSPVRVVVEVRPGRITGQLNLPGLEIYPNEHESEGERQGLMVFALCHDVSLIETQAVKEDINHPKKKSHIPDFRLTVNGEKILVERKPLKVAVKEEEIEKLIAIGQHYLATKQNFAILTDDQTDIEPRKSNVAILRRFLISPVSHECETRIFTCLENGPLTVREMMLSKNESDTFRDVCSLVARRKLTFDWGQLLSRESQVSLPDKPHKGLRYADVIYSGRFHSLLKELALGRRPEDSRLLAAARARDWTVPAPSAEGNVGGLPPTAFVGRFRTIGSLLKNESGEPEKRGSSPRQTSESNAPKDLVK